MLDKNIPIVFVHGYQGSANIWENASYFFVVNNHNNVFVFDYSDITGEKITHIANRMWEFLKEIKLTNGPIILIGHSMGGLVIRKVALDHPELNVVKLVTLATPNFGVAYSNLCVIPVTPWCPDAVLDMKPNSNFLHALNKSTVLKYTPCNVLTYSIKGDEMISEETPLIHTAKNLTFNGEVVFPNDQSSSSTKAHSAIVDQEEVLNNVLEFIEKEYTIINGGPNLYGGDCTVIPSNNGTIRWELPKGSPNTLQMEIISHPYTRPERIIVAASDEVKEDLSNGYVLLRFYDPSENIVTKWSSVHFDSGIFRCNSIIDNHANVITNWSDRF